MQQLPPALAGMAQYATFVLWRHATNKRGKPIKAVTDSTGKIHSAHDPAVHMTFEDASTHAARLGCGVGFVFGENDPFWFLDIDKCLQPDNTWSPLATTLCQALAGCAIEVSTSGTGLHIIGRGKLPDDHACKNTELGIELYDTGRFVALTGTNASGDCNAEISPALASWLVDYYFKPRARHNSPDWTTEPCDEWRGPVDDDDLIRRACHSKSAGAVFGNRATFNDLWSDNVDVLATSYPPQNAWDPYDRSSADLALASHLAFWTGRNAERIERLMRQSKLVREKWDNRSDYLPATIIEACALNKDVCLDKPVAGLTANGASVVLDTDSGREISTRDPLPHTTLSGKPKAVKENYAEVFQRAGVICRYDVIGKRVEILIPGHAYHSDKSDVARLAWLSSLCAHFGLPRDVMPDYITYFANQNPYNPVLTWIESKPWDGESRLPRFFETITPANDSALPDGRRLRDVLMLRWMLTAVAAAASPDGFATQGILVLSGAQGLGKSRWVDSLAPNELGVIRIGAILKPDDRDSITASVRTWVTELGELDATLRKSDVAQLKAFITNPADVVRLPYERAESKFARRTAFVATCNKHEFLVDDTGNRKFWVIATSNVNADHGFDMQQVWAEVLHLWREGQPAYLLPDERAALDTSNEDHSVIDPIEDQLTTRLRWDAPKTQWTWRSVTQILADVGVDRPNRSDTTKAGIVLERLGSPLKRSATVRLRLAPPVASPFAVAGIQP
ncbi:VapE domain-containing protein [Bordetella tumulicola]|uniref:phage NrS-1 polymerase family protein n=1 Tax=Bordetella tumulicola TaxID=1649133 RepID=UPI0039EEC3BB